MRHALHTASRRRIRTQADQGPNRAEHMLGRPAVPFAVSLKIWRHMAADDVYRISEQVVLATGQCGSPISPWRGSPGESRYRSPMYWSHASTTRSRARLHHSKRHADSTGSINLQWPPTGRPGSRTVGHDRLPRRARHAGSSSAPVHETWISGPSGIPKRTCRETLARKSGIEPPSPPPPLTTTSSWNWWVRDWGRVASPRACVGRQRAARRDGVGCAPC
jgi:hypothetical protein